MDFFFWAFFRENLWKFGNFQRGMFSLISIDYWKTIDDNSDVSDAGTSANSSSSSSPSSPSSSTSPSSSSALVAIDYPVNYRSSSPDGPDRLWMSHRVGIRHDSHVHFLFVCLFFSFYHRNRSSPADPSQFRMDPPVGYQRTHRVTHAESNRRNFPFNAIDYRRRRSKSVNYRASPPSASMN